MASQGAGILINYHKEPVLTSILKTFLQTCAVGSYRRLFGDCIWASLGILVSAYMRMSNLGGQEQGNKNGK